MQFDKPLNKSDVLECCLVIQSILDYRYNLVFDDEDSIPEFKLKAHPVVTREVAERLGLPKRGYHKVYERGVGYLG